MPNLTSTERDGGVALLRLQRTDKHNAFNREMALEVREAFDAFEVDDDVQAVVLAGSGKAFSAGADMNEAVAAIDENGRNDGMAASIVRIARFPKPLLACVNGFAYGGGALLAITCDIRIASDTAAFRFPGAAYGLVVGGAQLPRIVGPAFAKELLFTGRVVDAAEALRIGLVNHVVPAAEAESVTLDMARQIAANSPQALIATKATVDRASATDDRQSVENAANVTLRQSPEHHERFRNAAARVAGSGDPKRGQT